MELKGIFDYNRTPLEPPGRKVVIHVKDSQRKTWAPIGQIGWYIGPAKHHYRCFKVYSTATIQERISDTVHFLPHNSTIPALYHHEEIVQATQDLTSDIQKYSSSAPPEYPTKTLSDIKLLQNLFSTKKEGQEAEHTAPIKISKHVSPSQNMTTRLQRVVQDSHGMEERYQRVPTTPITPQTPTHRYPLRSLQVQQVNSIVDPVTGNTLEYKQLIKNPSTKELWEQ